MLCLRLLMLKNILISVENPSENTHLRWQIITYLGGAKTSSRNSSILFTSVLTSPLYVMKGGWVPGAKFWRSAGFLGWNTEQYRSKHGIAVTLNSTAAITKALPEVFTSLQFQKDTTGFILKKWVYSLISILNVRLITIYFNCLLLPLAVFFLKSV